MAEVSELLALLSLSKRIDQAAGDQQKSKRKKKKSKAPPVLDGSIPSDGTDRGTEVPILITTTGDEDKDEKLVAVSDKAAAATTDTEEIIYKEYGKFKCPNCSNKWTSAHGWKEKGQMCLKCSDGDYEVYVLPYRLEKRPVVQGPERKGMPHQRDMCQMCQSLKKNCVKVNAVKQRKKKSAEKKPGKSSAGTVQISSAQK